MVEVSGWLPTLSDMNQIVGLNLTFKENSILVKDEYADRSGGTLLFCSSGCIFCREREYSPAPAFLLTDLLSKGNFFQ